MIGYGLLAFGLWLLAMSCDPSVDTPEASKFRARERESNKFELSLRAQPKLNNKIVKGEATCHISAISVQKKTHHTRYFIRPQISRITRITHYSVSRLPPEAYTQLADSCEGVATRKIRAIRAISVQEKTHHSRIIHYRPQISRITRINIHHYRSYVPIRTAARAQRLARFVRLVRLVFKRKHLIRVSFIIDHKSHGLHELRITPFRVCLWDENKQQAARLGRTKVLFCATDAPLASAAQPTAASETMQPFREICDIRVRQTYRDVSFLQIAQRAQPRFNKVNLCENFLVLYLAIGCEL